MAYFRVNNTQIYRSYCSFLIGPIHPTTQHRVNQIQTQNYPRMFEKTFISIFLAFRLKMKCKILEYDRMCSSVKVLIFRNEKQGQF